MQPSSPLQPNPAIRELTAYKPSAARHEITLKLDANEGRAPRSLWEKLASQDPAIVGRYPNASALEEKLADRLGVAPEQLLVTAGADDGLDRICRSVLCAGKSAVMATPTFVMLPRYATLAGGEVRGVPWMRHAYPTDAIVARCDDSTTLVAVVSPQNPTGAVVSANDLQNLRERVPHALLVVDLAYGELADEDLTSVALSLPNTVVVRTLSKAWGLAGLRIGYVAGPVGVVDWLRRVGNPYAVSSPSIALALAQLDDDSEMLAYVARVRKERADLYELLDERGARPLPSRGNFVLCEPEDPAQLVEQLAERGIGVRTWPGDETLRAFVRISVPGDETQMQRLEQALREVLR